MDKTTVWFIKASMIYFVIGATIGLFIAMLPEWTGIYRSIHVHLNLIGWMSMMIFGVGYHILPRFSGKPLFSPSLARVQFWLSNIGLVGLSFSWAFLYHTQSAVYQFSLVFFALLEVIAVYLFVYNIFKTIQAAPAA